MVRYTTPSLTMTIKGYDLTAQQKVWVSIQEDGVAEVDKTGSSVSVSVQTVDDQPVSTVSCSLTQAESAQFKWEAEVQVNWISSQGVRQATVPKKIPIIKQLLEQEISYGN